MSPIMEPLDVASSREELATLVADKQRMEAQHKRLQRHLREIRAKMAEVQEVSCREYWGGGRRGQCIVQERATIITILVFCKPCTSLIPRPSFPMARV